MALENFLKDLKRHKFELQLKMEQQKQKQHQPNANNNLNKHHRVHLEFHLVEHYLTSK